MKKLKLNENVFNKGILLDRQQLQKIMGGTFNTSAPGCKDSETSCNVYFKDEDRTEKGYCSSYGHMEGDFPVVECFCQTENHTEPSPLHNNASSVCSY